MAHYRTVQHQMARTPFGLRRQLQLLSPVLLTWATALVAITVAGQQNIAPLESLFLDAAYLGQQPWYTGILSEAGLISWAVAATVAGLGSWVAARTGRRSAARFLACGAGVVGLMLMDVWVQFHSSVAPKLGIPSTLAQAAIAGSGIAWLLWFRTEVARTRWLILLFSFAFLGGSAGIDTVFEPHGALGLLLEDGGRLIGILTLTHYLGATTIDILRSVVPAGSIQPAGHGRVSGQSSLPPPRSTTDIPTPVPR